MREDEAYQQEMEHREWYEDYDKAIKPGENKMKLNEVYTGGEFLKAEDLQGKTVRLIITEIGVHEFDDKKKQLVLSFRGADKRLGLNITNANSIAKILGDDTDNWIGGEIKVYPTTTDFGDKRNVPCIRVIEELPPEANINDNISFIKSPPTTESENPAPPAAKDDFDDDIPF